MWSAFYFGKGERGLGSILVFNGARLSQKVKPTF